MTALVVLAAFLLFGGLLCAPKRNHISKGMTYAEREAFFDSLTPAEQERANQLGLY